MSGHLIVAPGLAIIGRVIAVGWLGNRRQADRPQRDLADLRSGDGSISPFRRLGIATRGRKLSAMDDDGEEHLPSVATANTSAVARARARRPAAPPVVDAEFRVLPPVWRLWRTFQASWWAIGPYLAYCTGLWGLAALVGWFLDRGRGG
jgi:hypothetical protein